MDDETFDRLLGEDTDAPATTGPSAAETNAIEAAVPDGEDVPEDDDGAEADEADQDAAAGDGVQAEGDEETEAEADAEAIPISDPRHPDHAYFQKAQEAEQRQSLEAQARQELRQLQQLKQITDTINGLPDADPDKLPGIVNGLIAQVVAPVRQQAQANEAMAETMASVGSSMHLAMVEYLPPEWVEALMNRATELRAFGSVEAASHVVKVGKDVAARENAEITRLRQENALLKKTAKATGRSDDADRVPMVRPARSATAAPAEGESKFDRFFNEQVLGQGR